MLKDAIGSFSLWRNFVIEPTGFEHRTLEEVLANFLYTDEGMFGTIVFDAQRELYRRIPPPKWAKNHPLPTMAKEWHHD